MCIFTNNRTLLFCLFFNISSFIFISLYFGVLVLTVTLIIYLGLNLKLLKHGVIKIKSFISNLVNPKDSQTKIKDTLNSKDINYSTPKMYGSEKNKFFGSRNVLSPITKNGETSNGTMANGKGRRPVTAIYDSQRTTHRSPSNGLRLSQSPRYALSEDSATNFPWGGVVSPSNSTGVNLRLRGRAAGVKTAQTVAGPLLASTRNRIDAQMYADIHSPGLTTRLVQYNDSNIKPTVQSKYRGPGQLPIVNLNKSPMITISPRRPAVTVRIAPPDVSSYGPDRTQFFGTSEDHRPLQPSIQDTPSAPTRSVLDALKEISRKRIHSHVCQDDDEEFSKRPKKEYVVPALSGPSPFSRPPISKRPREDDISPTKSSVDNEKYRPNKRHRNMKCNDILSSLSSSKNMNDVVVQPPTKRKLENRAAIEGKLKRLASETVSQISISSTIVKSSEVVIESEPSSAIADKSGEKTNENISKSNVDETNVNTSTTDGLNQNKTPTTPKLTLFKKVITSDIETDLASLSDDDSFGEMAFVKPKKASPLQKSETMNKTEKSKLSQMLNCLGDKLETNGETTTDGLLSTNQIKEFSKSSEKTPVNTSPITFSIPQINANSNTNTETKLDTISTTANIVPITSPIISTSLNNSSEPVKTAPSLFGTSLASSTTASEPVKALNASDIVKTSMAVFSDALINTNTSTMIKSVADTNTIKPVNPIFSFGSKNEEKLTETSTFNSIPTLSNISNTTLNTSVTKSHVETPFNTSITSVNSNPLPFGTTNTSIINTSTSSKLPSTVISSSPSSLFGNNLLSSAFSKPSETSSFVSTNSTFGVTSNTQLSTSIAPTSSVATTASAAPFSFTSSPPFGTASNLTSTNLPISFGIKDASTTSATATPATATFPFGNASNSQLTQAVTNPSSTFTFGQAATVTANTGNEFKFEVKKPGTNPINSTLSQDPKPTFGSAGSPFAFGVSPSLPTTIASNSTFGGGATGMGQLGTTPSNNLNPSKSGFSFGSSNQTPLSSNAPVFPTSNSGFGNLSKNASVTEESKMFSFGKNTQLTPPVTSAFGVPANNGNGFGNASTKVTPSFGVNPNGTTSGSAFGAPTVATFGSVNATNKPATFGGSTSTAPQSSNVFGAAPTTTAATFAFGSSSNTTKPSAFGAPAPSSFGSSTSTFGATSSAPTFGSSSGVTPSFGSTTSGFGTPDNSAFGSKPTQLPAFGSSSAPGFVSSLITSPSFGARNASSGFGSTSSSSSSTLAFGASAPATTTNFGTATATPTFGGSTATATFGGSTATPTFGGSTATPTFGGSTATPTFGASANGQSPASFGFGTSTAPKSNTPVFAFGGSAPPNTTAPASGAFNFGSSPAPAVGGFNFNSSTTAPNLSFGSSSAAVAPGTFGSTNAGFGAAASSFGGGGEGPVQFGTQGNGFGLQPAYNAPATPGGVFSIGAGGASSRSRTPRQRRQR